MKWREQFQKQLGGMIARLLLCGTYPAAYSAEAFPPPADIRQPAELDSSVTFPSLSSPSQKVDSQDGEAIS